MSVAVCRMILNLRQVYLPDGNGDAPTVGQQSRLGTMLSFRIPASVVGNAGAPLRTIADNVGQEGEDGEDDEVVVTDDPLMAGIVTKISSVRAADSNSEDGGDEGECGHDAQPAETSRTAVMAVV